MAVRDPALPPAPRTSMAALRQAAERIEAGETLASVARSLGLEPGTLAKRFVAAGVDRSVTKNRRGPVEIQAVLEVVARHGRAKAAKLLGITPNAIAGLKRRNKALLPAPGE